MHWEDFRKNCSNRSQVGYVRKIFLPHVTSVKAQTQARSAAVPAPEKEFIKYSPLFHTTVAIELTKKKQFS